jgi:sugar (pentulose or hexulose) kinase
MSGAYIGVDLGTSSVKAVALDASGRAVAQTREPYRTERPAPGRAEQDPSSWTAAARTALGAIAAGVSPEVWQGIGLSGMIPTLVTLDDDGLPTGPALTWQDSRAQAEAAEILRRCGPAGTYALTGQPLDGRYLLPMFAWTARHDPERAARTSIVMGAKDYVFAWLTGEYLTDPSTATGYGCYGLRDGAWLPHVAEAAGVATGGGRAGRPGLPPVVPSTETRPILRELASALGIPAGLPVCAGAADSVLASEALDATAPGSVAYVWGTSTVILGAGAGLVTDPQRRCLVTPLAISGWGVEMDLVSTGAAVEWLARLLGFGPRGQAEVIAAAAATEDGLAPVALPFLGVGEQGALWDARVRGSLVGLDLSHGPAEVARALLDGIILESRRCLARLQDLGLPAGDVRVAWRGADPWFCRRLADAGGRAVTVGDPVETSSAAGAARLAATATGAVLRAPAVESVRYEPDATRSRLWDRRWREYEDVLEPLRQLYRTWPPQDDGAAASQ